MRLEALAQTYERDGFTFPVDVVNALEAQEIRDDLELAESELSDDPERLMLLRSYPDRLLPSFDRLIRKVCQDAPMVQLKDIRKGLKYKF